MALLDFRVSLIRPLASVLRKFLNDDAHPAYFRRWQRAGINLLPNHYYQPVPDLDALADDVFTRPSGLVGIDMRDNRQLAYLRETFPLFRDEYAGIPAAQTGDPAELYLGNPFFGGTDALVLYCMVRHFQPAKVIECGSGYSTLVAARAAEKNGHTEITCIEPFPHAILDRKIPPVKEFLRSPVENVPLKHFTELKENDILFIDTTHVVRCGGDVNYLVLEVLPRLAKGVVVHVHDVFFPFEYPREWVMTMHRFWTEQYLLQAFLAFNASYEILFCNHYMGWKFPQEMKSAFPTSPWHGGASLWIRKVQ